MAMEEMPSNVQVEVDVGFGSTDATSDYEDSLESDTTSLISSAKAHVFDNGRRYHGWREGLYNLPNDAEEQNRLDIFHHMVTLVLNGKLHLAPISKNPQYALDIGTGTGIWANVPVRKGRWPIQPEWVPPNVSFEVDDIEDTWPSEHSNLDYIHGRGLAGFIRDRQKLASQAFTALAPGGYYELQEQGDPMQCTDGTVPPDSVLREWVERWEDAARLIGSPWLEVSRKGALKKELEDAGFVDVEECMFIIPNGPWPKDPKLKKIGEYSLLHLVDGASSLTTPFMRVLGWKKHRVEEFVERVLATLRLRQTHSFMTLHVAYGRKPAQ